MTIIEYVLIGIILAYTVFFVSCNLSIILKYRKYKQKGNVKITNGRICEKLNEEKKAYKEQMITFCYPKYEYEKKGQQEKCYIVSSVKQKNVVIGEQSEIGYCEDNNEAWIINELPIIKRNLFIKTAILLSVMIIFVATSLLM